MKMEGERGEGTEDVRGVDDTAPSRVPKCPYGIRGTGKRLLVQNENIRFAKIKIIKIICQG